MPRTWTNPHEKLEGNRRAKSRGNNLQASASHHGYRGPAALDFQVVYQQLRDVLKFEFKGSP